VVHTHNPSYLGGRDKRIMVQCRTRGQWEERWVYRETKGMVPGQLTGHGAWAQGVVIQESHRPLPPGSASRSRLSFCLKALSPDSRWTPDPPQMWPTKSPGGPIHPSTCSGLSLALGFSERFLISVFIYLLLSSPSLTPQAWTATWRTGRAQYTHGEQACQTGQASLPTGHRGTTSSVAGLK
jgi:hypothetical protein